MRSEERVGKRGKEVEVFVSFLHHCTMYLLSVAYHQGAFDPDCVGFLFAGASSVVVGREGGGVVGQRF